MLHYTKKINSSTRCGKALRHSLRVHNLMWHRSKLWLRQELVPIFGLHTLCGDTFRVVSQEHVGEVCSVVNALLRLLTSIVSRQWLEHGLEARLVEVGEGESLAGVQANLVRRGWQE